MFSRKFIAGGVTLASCYAASVFVYSAKNKDRDIIQQKVTLENAVTKARDLCLKVKDESGSPGLVVAVSIDGETVYSAGFGYADVENRVRCKPDTVLRVASISKSLTMTAVGKLMEENKIDLDKPVREYLPKFPEKYVDGEKVDITLRHLVSHLAGIRHYEKDREKALHPKKHQTSSDEEKETSKKEKAAQPKDEFEHAEYYIKDRFPSVEKALTLFENDELFTKPGTHFLYTTHGWTLISAVVESIVKKPFHIHMKKIFHELGMSNTCLDENKPLIYNRARYYVRNKKGRLENAPYVDNSYKWAGGGFLSTVVDLVGYGNAMLFSFQNSGGFLRRDIMRLLWMPVANTKMSWDQDGQYAMGWGVVENQINFPYCNKRRFYVSHTGGAVGASSVLLVLPRDSSRDRASQPKVSGVVVCIIANLQSVGLNKTALDIANLFDQVQL